MIHLPTEPRAAESASVRFFSTAGDRTTLATFEGGSSSRSSARELNQSHHDISFAPRVAFGLICGALIFYLRPEAAPGSWL